MSWLYRLIAGRCPRQASRNFLAAFSVFCLQLLKPLVTYDRLRVPCVCSAACRICSYGMNLARVVSHFCGENSRKLVNQTSIDCRSLDVFGVYPKKLVVPERTLPRFYVRAMRASCLLATVYFSFSSVSLPLFNFSKIYGRYLRLALTYPLI